MKLFLLTLLSTLLIGVTSVQSEQGLNYKYYEGTFSLLPDFNSLTPVKSGVVTSPNLDQRRRENQYAFLFQGYITIPAAGNYTFETLSDDGSKLYIGTHDYNAIALVNNDGLHSDQTRTGTIALNAGVYPIMLSFFQNGGNQTWEFYWSSNTGIPHQKIPSSVLSTSSTTTPGASGTAGLNYSYYEGEWSNLPNFSSLTPIKTGTTSNVDLAPRRRERQYAFVWQGYINIPVTGTYSFQSSSDDGSMIYVGSTTTPVVSNDGLHSTQSINANVNLTAGLNPIIIAYFQNEGNQIIEVTWASASAGIARQKIPDNVLSTAGGTVSPPASTGSLNYNYYEGTWSNLPDFSSLTPVKSGSSANIDLSPRNRDKQYAFVWQGSINIPASGNYSFETSSDDGSKVYIGSTEVVNNDGLHGYKTSNGSIALNAGLNPITVTYFQNDGDQYMELYWASNTGISRQRVPSSVLSASSSVVPPAAPAPAPPVEVPVTPPPSAPGSGGLTGVNNYYFSSTNGDDSRSAAQAKNPSTPWRTINKLNSVMSSLQAGDAVLFNRGDVFDGSINMTTSGIIVSAYGNGNKPIVTGFSTLSNWTSIGNGVWQAGCPSADRINMVAMNGNAQAMGRYPNITERDRGYNRYEAHNGTSQITDYQLSGSINYTGAEVVVRKNNWVLDRALITNHSGNTINYNSPTAHVPIDNYGYFIQNSPYTLDQLGEWYFDPSQKVLKMYFGSNNPNSYEVKASTVNTLLLISSKANITIDNISFTGGDDYSIKVEYAQNIRVQNCTIDLSGTQAVSSFGVNNFAFEANSITNTNNDALDVNGTNNSAIRYNNIKNTGLLIGMGQSGNQQYNGILVEGSGNTVEYNSIINTGYSGISFAGESVLIKNNYIDNFCLTIEDGGGVYTWGDLTKYNRKIVGNIIVNGIGTSEGTTYEFSTGATGIFNDDESANIEMTDNTIANCSRAGIFFHNAHEMSMKNNTVFNNRTQIIMIHDPIAIDHPIRNLTLDNNILFSRISSQFIMEVGTIKNDLANFGNFNNNYYSRPTDDNGIIYSYYKENPSANYQYAFYDVNGWRTAYSVYDQQTKASPVKIPPYVVNSYYSGNRYTNSSFNSNTSGVYCLSSPGKCSITWNNGGKLDGGAVQLSYDPIGNTPNDVGTYIDLGPVQGGRSYQVKFSLIGSKPGKTLKAYFLDGVNYSHLSETKYFEMGTSRTENEFLFNAPVSTTRTTIAFEGYGPDGPYWMDNFEMYEANITVVNPDDYIRFLFNATTNAQSYAINGNYVDAKNNAFSGNITLQPFTSAVLIKKTGGLLTQSARQTNVASSQIVQEAEDSKSLNVRVTPNPTRNNLQILLNAPQGTQKTNLSIYNISGVLVKAIPITSTTQNLNVDVSTWAKGAYIINYVCDGHIVYKKFVKQ